MDEKYSKPQVWNYDSVDPQKSPELQTQQKPSWSKVGAGMAQDVREHFTVRWYFNLTAIFIILLISAFISKPLALIMVMLNIGHIILVFMRSQKSAYRTGAIIGWAFIGLVLILLVLLI